MFVSSRCEPFCRHSFAKYRLWQSVENLGAMTRSTGCSARPFRTQCSPAALLELSI